MHKLLEKVEKELEGIGEKGLSSSNLDTTYKLIDIYKDIKESKYYESQTKEGNYDDRMRDSRERYMYNYDRYGDSYNRYDEDNRNSGKYREEKYSRRERLGPMERYFVRLEDEVDNYNVSKNRYRNGGSQERVTEGMEMIMEAIHKFIECLSDYTETPQEKEIIRKHIDKMKNI